MTVPNSGEGQRSVAVGGQSQRGTDVEAPGRVRDDATGEVVPSGPRSGGRRGKRAAGENLWAYIFLTPWLLGLCVLMLGPMLATLYLYFTDYPLFAGPEWTALDNYKRMFSDDTRYLKCLKVTFIYVLLS